MKKDWKVVVRNTNKEYKLASMNFENQYIEIYTDESIRKQYGYKEVRVFHGDRELDLDRNKDK